jgi:hypothetical protein
MPWTIAHAAAVLPLRRLRTLPFPALVAGCMSPDLGYYIGRSDWASPAHRLYPGLLLAIPAGLALLAAWRALAPFARAAVPTPFAVFFDRDTEGASQRKSLALAWLCLALAIGAATHIAWDGLTHAHGWFVYRTPFMRVPVDFGNWYALPRYRLAQHLSTLFGCALLLASWWRASRGLDWPGLWRQESERLRLVLLVALLVAAASVSFLSAPVLDANLRVEDRLYHYALVAPLWFVGMLCAAGAVLRRTGRQ